MRLLNKVAVTGASGMLGTAILNRFAGYCNLYPTSRTKGLTGNDIHWNLFDLHDPKKLVEWLTIYQPNEVIHCAAMVDVDECEREDTKAYNIHSNVAKVIAATISAWNGRLIYISTDAVFDGKLIRPYVEEDKPCPVNKYGQSKLSGEIETLRDSTQHLVLRTTIFGLTHARTKPSFAEWILKGLNKKTPLVMFNDVTFTPIHVAHVAEIIYSILTHEKKLSGVYHLSGSTTLSKYEFALKLANSFGLSTHSVLPSSLDKSNLLASRGKNMALSNQKLANAINLELPAVEAGIECLKIQYENGCLK